jgi:hypothetical protein
LNAPRTFRQWEWNPLITHKSITRLSYILAFVHVFRNELCMKVGGLPLLLTKIKRGLKNLCASIVYSLFSPQYKTITIYNFQFSEQNLFSFLCDCNVTSCFRL